jgi:hypothetical protein
VRSVSLRPFESFAACFELFVGEVPASVRHAEFFQSGVPRRSVTGQTPDENVAAPEETQQEE